MLQVLACADRGPGLPWMDRSEAAKWSCRWRWVRHGAGAESGQGSLLIRAPESPSTIGKRAWRSALQLWRLLESRWSPGVGPEIAAHGVRRCGWSLAEGLGGSSAACRRSARSMERQAEARRDATGRNRPRLRIEPVEERGRTTPPPRTPPIPGPRTRTTSRHCRDRALARETPRSAAATWCLGGGRGQPRRSGGSTDRPRCSGSPDTRSRPS